MKKVPCSGPDCERRRSHFESDQPRGVQYVEVQDDFVGNAFCSIECMMYFASRKVKCRHENEEIISGISGIPSEVVCKDCGRIRAFDAY